MRVIRFLFYPLLIALIACVGYIILLSTGTEDWQQEYDTLKANTVKEMESKDIIIEQHEAEIVGLNVEIEESKAEVEEIKSRIVVQDKNLEGLEATERELAEKDETLEVVKQQRDNYKQQVAIWKNKFNLSQDIIKKKDEMIFSLNGKYDAQFGTTLQWKGKHEDLGELLVGSEMLAKKRGDRIKVLEVKAKLSGGIVKAGVAAIIIYGAMKLIFKK